MTAVLPARTRRVAVRIFLAVPIAICIQRRKVLLSTLSTRWGMIFVLVPILLVTRLLVLLHAALRSGHSESSTGTTARWRGNKETVSLGVFLGSGGHTSEMRTLLTALEFERYTPRVYVYCYGDDMSLRAVAELESSKGSAKSNNYSVLPLPRARRVGQPVFSSALSTLWTLLVATYHTLILPICLHPTTPWVDALMVNGPGTAVVLVLIDWIRRFFFLPHSRIIYVESFARTSSLSLSGTILRRIKLVDVFVVQWPNAARTLEHDQDPQDRPKERAADRGMKVTYRGWVV